MIDKQYLSRDPTLQLKQAGNYTFMFYSWLNSNVVNMAVFTNSC